MALLSRIMIRAAKSDLVTIPPCHHKVHAPLLFMCVDVRTGQLVHMQLESLVVTIDTTLVSSLLSILLTL